MDPIFRNEYDEFAKLFVAPSYIPYVVHLVNDSVCRNIRKLFFVSRDAYILQKIAEQFAHEKVEFKYLFVSRASLEGAFFHVATKKELTDTGIAHQKDATKNYQDDFDITQKYLEQEGVFEDNIALVDVGWFGRTRAMINCLRRQKGKGPLFCYYYGIHDICLSKEYGDFDYYIKKPLHPEWSTYVIEEYFSRCPYPTTIGYFQDESGIISPLFPKGKVYDYSALVNANEEACIQLAKKYRDCPCSEAELYAMMTDAHRILFKSNYVARHKELHSIFNDQCKSVYNFNCAEIKKFIKKGEFDYTINVNANLRLAVGDFGFVFVLFFQKIYHVLLRIKHSM